MGECDHDFSNSPRYRFDPPPAPLQVRCAKCHIYVNVDESTPATPRTGEAESINQTPATPQPKDGDLDE